jgi:hypothetical protein
MIIVRLLSPEPVGWFCHHQLYSGIGADIVMESITLIMALRRALECNGAYTHNWSGSAIFGVDGRKSCHSLTIRIMRP